jgi:hypothetical protein
MAKWIMLASVVAMALGATPQQPQPAKKFQAPPVGDILPLLDTKSPQALAGVLRGAVLRFMPDPLFESAPNWGHQRMVANQLKWKNEGIFIKPKIYKAPKNDGVWKKVRLLGSNLPDTLVLDLRNISSPQANQLNFDVFLSFDARLEYDHQIWDAGTRIYAASVQARFRVKLLLKCEATAKLDSGKSWLPDAVFRLHATGANLSYDNLVFEHVAGIGGSGAKLLGKAFYNIVRDFNPALEKHMLERAAESIVKAADTKEVRISFAKVFEKLLPSGK